MPLLESPKGRSDGGYAVSDFRRVQPELAPWRTWSTWPMLPGKGYQPVPGLCHEPHQRGPRVGPEGPGGGARYRERYFFYDNWEIPQEFEKTVPQVFPTTAPGSFTWLDDCKQVVMTNFYPYQWDLNYANPVSLTT